MNFKDLQFSIGKLKADVHSQIAKNNPLQKQDTKALSMWIFQERNDLATMRTKAYKQSETIKALKEWVKEEVAEETIDNSRDLEDLVGDKLCRLLDKQIEIEQEFAVNSRIVHNDFFYTWWSSQIPAIPSCYQVYPRTRREASG
ncbi:hypothetical protein BDF20DRAFT_6699 [Mycotypha africana]|uniref:uncharacterized protein n=1 Tax=Mycotypha africana TaxID=64632 RepID=UPI0023017F8C|nr:uncharacterized protein BDF20DRAFT_6699 [Mycotypha africana]KAI8990871.1 hypothetical protein BDF20DRAFT_6699 [Mycotypha africana]